MTTSPRLTRSVPFWLLVAGSAGTLAAGAYLLIDRLGGMDARLTDGTATTNDVYVGQMWAVLGAVLVGVGAIGLALALTLGALRSLLAQREAVAIADEVEPAFVEELPDAQPHAEVVEQHDATSPRADDQAATDDAERASLTR